MKIVNKTKYRTADLSAFLYWVAREEGYDSSYTKRVVATVVPSKKYHTGYGYFNSGRITIRIPRPELLNKMKLASLVAHEMLHNQQTEKSFKKYSTERQMRSSSRYGYKGHEKHWSGAEELPVRLVEVKAKQVEGPHDRALKGQAKAAKKVASYEKKIKQAEALLKKWRKKQKYYDKRVEATKDLPPPELKERKAPQHSEKTLIRRAINKHITNHLSREDRCKWEVYYMGSDGQQASGLRGSWDEEWGGDFTDLKHARKIVNPSEIMFLRGYEYGDYGEFCAETEIQIPSREELLGQVALKKAAMEGK